MPNEHDSDSPSADSQDQSLPQWPVTPSAPHENKLGKKPEGTSSDKDDTVIKLEQDIKTGERWLIKISAAGVILNAVIALIYLGQLHEMRRATRASTKAADAATSAADTADKTLKEIRSGSVDTHELAVQSKNQTAEAGRQVKSLEESNRISRESLESVQRAFIVFVNHGTDFFNQTEQGVDVPYVKIRAIWANTGTTSAPVAVQNFRFRSFGNREPYSQEFLDEMDHPPIAGVIGPKVEWDSVSRYVQESHLYAPESTPNNRRFSGTWVGFGFIVYRDVFHHPHVTETCQFSTEDLPTKPQRTILWSSCPDFNCVDEYCPNFKELTALLPPEPK